MSEKDTVHMGNIEIRELVVPNLPDINETSSEISNIVFDYFQNLWRANCYPAPNTSLVTSLVAKTTSLGFDSFIVLRKRFNGLSDTELSIRTEQLNKYKERSSSFSNDDRSLLIKQQDEALKELGVKNLAGVKAVEDYALNFVPNVDAAQSIALGRISVKNTSVFTSRTHNLPPERELYNLPNVRGNFEVFPITRRPEITYLFLEGNNINTLLQSENKQGYFDALMNSLQALTSN